MACIYKKPFLGKSQRKVAIFDGFCLPWERNGRVLRALESVNCDCEDGVLQTGLGATVYHPPRRVASGVVPPGYTQALCLVESGGSLENGQKKERFYLFQNSGAYEYDEELRSYVRKGGGVLG